MTFRHHFGEAERLAAQAGLPPAARDTDVAHATPQELTARALVHAVLAIASWPVSGEKPEWDPSPWAPGGGPGPWRHSS